MKYKVVIATDSYLPRWDGVTRFLTEIIPSLKKDFDVSIIAPDFGEHKPLTKTTKLPLKNQQFGDIRPARVNQKRIKHLIKKSDVVFVQTFGPIGAATINAAKQLKIPVVSYVHVIETELFPKALNNPYMKLWAHILSKWHFHKYLRKSDLILLPSKGTEDKLSWDLKNIARKTVHLGVNTDEFAPSKSKTRKEDAGFDPKDIVIGYHGRIAHEKDLLTLLRAFKRVNRRNKKTKLLIVGSGVKDIMKKLKQKDVVLVGSKNNVVKYLQAMDIYVMPSLTETTCLSVLEAMSCRLPVISTPAGYVKDYIKHKKNGMIFEFQNSFVLSRYIEHLIAHPETRMGLGIAARETVKKEFKWTESRKAISKALQAICKTHR